MPHRADDMSDDVELPERESGLRAALDSERPPRWEPVLSFPAVSGDECVRALLAAGCRVDGFAGRAWTLLRDDQRFAVPRHQVLDAEVLVDILRHAKVPLDAFIRTLERLDLLRGQSARPSRAPAPIDSASIDLGHERETLPLVSGDELADALRARGWVVWNRTPLVSRLARRGESLIIPRDGVLNAAFLVFLLERAGVAPAELPELLLRAKRGAK